jgi:hypothetical protein
MPALNPLNPFVADDHYFESYANKTIYKDTTLYLIRTINDTFLFVIGLFLSSLVFYLIFKQMPSNFKPYRKMLMLTACIDSFMVVANFLIQTVSLFVALKIVLLNFKYFLNSTLT